MDEITKQMADVNMIRGMCTHQDLTPKAFDDCFGFSCDGCHEMGYGSCYICTNGCDYQLHKECVTASPVANHRFFQNLSFTLQHQESPDTNSLCTACGMAVKGLRYISNYQGATVYLHPCCIKMPHSVEIDGEHTLFLKEKLVNVVECEYCERTTLEGPIEGWAYVSADQETGFHLNCMKNMIYEAWDRYVQMEEEGPDMEEEPWWRITYGGPEFDDDLAPWVEPSNVISPDRSAAFARRVVSIQSNIISPARPVASAQRPQDYHNASQPQNNPTRPTGRGRRRLWKWIKAAVKVFIYCASEDPFGCDTSLML